MFVIPVFGKTAGMIILLRVLCDLLGYQKVMASFSNFFYAKMHPDIPDNPVTFSLNGGSCIWSLYLLLKVAAAGHVEEAPDSRSWC